HVWGNLDLLKQPSIGFCGSRNVSEKGLSITADVVQQMVGLNRVIVSGHASGVDIMAHRTALECGGATIIVIAEGMANFRLHQEVKQLAKPDSVLIISGFEPDARWTVNQAMIRNNTIIGLSDAVVLIESRLEGGTFNAGEAALQLNVPIFVAEYETTTANNKGNAYFIQHGAIALRKSAGTGRANIAPMKDLSSSNRNLNDRSSNDLKTARSNRKKSSADRKQSSMF
ncbi:MAG TPA: DNA-processing protein DprA, partial [Phototrophicaceae bacterium]|nr:DNA-processing protein DprA [Phototrophicaceae bacterium]